MPSRTERQKFNDALEQAFLVNLMVEAEAQLYDIGEDSDSSCSTSSSGSETSSGYTSSEDEPLLSTGEALLHVYGEANSERYYNHNRRTIDKSNELLQILLNDWKANRPEIFRSYLRISSGCFDDLVAVLCDDPIFHNNSRNKQTPVEEQLAIALYRFGHFGNAASTMKVALMFGVGYGTVRLFTARIMAATCSEHFRRSALRWSSGAVKEEAKVWVEENSCHAWRNGWLMVDGTLVPLFQRPVFFGNTFFDRKSNYSLNVQVSLLFII